MGKLSPGGTTISQTRVGSFWKSSRLAGGAWGARRSPPRAERVSGPLLALAGPGSGKPRANPHRIAYLAAHERVHPRRILAVTFTNKAAREMRDRIFALVGPDIARDITLGTFHAVCSRILRVAGERLGVA